MSGRKGHRAWGNIKKTAYEVSELSGFVHRPRPSPALRTDHLLIQNECRTMVVEERDYKECCEAAGETWKPPAERKREKKAEVLPLSKYGKTVIDQRILRPRIADSAAFCTPSPIPQSTRGCWTWRAPLTRVVWQARCADRCRNDRIASRRSRPSPGASCPAGSARRRCLPRPASAE